MEIVLREKENVVEVSIRGNLEKYGKDDIRGFVHDVLVAGLKEMDIDAGVRMLKLEQTYEEKVYRLEEEIPEGKLEAIIVEYKEEREGGLGGKYVDAVWLNGEETEKYEKLVLELFEKVRK